MAPDTLSLVGKVAIITGSGRENGIGANIAYALARNGAAVTINFVSAASAPRAAAVVKTIQDAGGKAIAVQANVVHEGDGKRLVSETLKAFGTGHIDILVNNAGITGKLESTLEIGRDGIQEVLNTNVLGLVLCTQAAVPHMPPGGRIINITSVASKMGFDLGPIYGASKAAVDSLSYAWAREFGQSKGLTVNSIAPGPVPTDINEGSMDVAESIAEPYVRAAKRVGTLEDIADAVLLIVSEKSRWITGQYISVSGGMTGN